MSFENFINAAAHELSKEANIDSPRFAFTTGPVDNTGRLGTFPEDFEWVDERPMPFTIEELQAKAQWISENFDLFNYSHVRKNAYPTIQEQLDMQYWDSVNGTTIWADTIAAIKAQYPKP